MCSLRIHYLQRWRTKWSGKLTLPVTVALLEKNNHFHQHSYLDKLITSLIDSEWWKVAMDTRSCSNQSRNKFGIGSDRFIHHILNKPLKGKREFVGVLRLCIKRLWRSMQRIANRRFNGRELGNICITITQMCLLETFALDYRNVKICKPVVIYLSVSR